VDGLALPSLTNATKEGLEGHFGKDEIIRALFDCCGDKAPGPDGMTMAFLQANSDTVRGDVMALFSEFHTNGKFVTSINSTFIALMPKRADAQKIKDYRLISLVGCVINCSRRCSLEGRGRLLVVLFLRIRMLLSMVGKFWMWCLLQMNLLTLEPSQVSRESFASLTLRRLTIMLIGIFSFMLGEEWGLGINGLLGLVVVFLLFLTQC